MTTEQHLITREIGIDMGHRVTHHGSKCRNLHGHRYTVQATCKGPLIHSGEQQGMVLDFGFLKDEMMREIDGPCDHGMCLWVDDPFARSFMATEGDSKSEGIIRDAIKQLGFCQMIGPFGKLYLVPFVPTAENLARHWFERLAPRVVERSEGQAELVRISVGATPNCTAEYKK